MTYPHFSAVTSPLRSLEAMFVADIAYLADHPNIQRMLLGALGRTNSSALRLMIEAVIQRYEQRLSSIIEEAQQCGEMNHDRQKDRCPSVHSGYPTSGV